MTKLRKEIYEKCAKKVETYSKKADILNFFLKSPNLILVQSNASLERLSQRTQLGVSKKDQVKNFLLQSPKKILESSGDKTDNMKVLNNRF